MCLFNVNNGKNEREGRDWRDIFREKKIQLPSAKERSDIKLFEHLEKITDII